MLSIQIIPETRDLNKAIFQPVSIETIPRIRMKNLVYTTPFLIATLLMTSTVFGQLENRSTFKLGYNFNGDQFGNLDDYNNELQQRYVSDNDEFEEDPAYLSYDRPVFGFSLEMGHLYYIKAISTPEWIGLGLDVSYIELNYSQVNHKLQLPVVQGYTFDNEFTSNQITVGPKIGPMVSFTPGADLVLDFSFKLQPFVTGVFGTYDVQGPDGTDANLKDGVAGYGFGLRYTPGIYFRYDVFMIGAEANIGQSNEKITSLAMGGETIENKTKLNNFKVVFGVNF